MRNDYFRDCTGATPKPLDLWEPIVIPKEEIDAEIERLANLPAPANGRRRSIFVHPRNQKSQGLAPDRDVEPLLEEMPQCSKADPGQRHEAHRVRCHRLEETFGLGFGLGAG